MDVASRRTFARMGGGTNVCPRPAGSRTTVARRSGTGSPPRGSRVGRRVRFGTPRPHRPGDHGPDGRQQCELRARELRPGDRRPDDRATTRRPDRHQPAREGVFRKANILFDCNNDAICATQRSQFGRLPNLSPYADKGVRGNTPQSGGTIVAPASVISAKPRVESRVCPATAHDGQERVS